MNEAEPAARGLPATTAGLLIRRRIAYAVAAVLFLLVVEQVLSVVFNPSEPAHPLLGLHKASKARRDPDPASSSSKEELAPAMGSATAAVRGMRGIVPGKHMMEGAGVRICRTVGTQRLRNLDPFLMLDELKLPSKDASAGFPDHPHRGFETCTIVLRGKVEHEDSVGNKGVIGPGGVQWMTAGRGIVHSEFPKSQGNELLWGFQLWINLPKKDKLCRPMYQDYQADRIPTADAGANLKVRVMSGEFGGVTGPIKMRNPGFLFDVKLSKGATFSHAFPESWNAFAYVYDQSEGKSTMCGTPTKVQSAHVLETGQGEVVSAETDGHLHFLLFAGKPIGEPIVQHGPFVMNTQEEIYQAFMDYQSGRLQSNDVEILT